MSDAALEYWDYYAPRLVEAGILTELDRDTLHHLCEFAVLSRQAWADLEDAPLVVESERGSKKNPLLQIVRDSTTCFRLLAADLGLTPTARARLNIAEPAELSELDRLLGYDDDD